LALAKKALHTFSSFVQMFLCELQRAVLTFQLMGHTHSHPPRRCMLNNICVDRLQNLAYYLPKLAKM